MKQFVLGALVATAVLGAAGFAVIKEPVAGTKKSTSLMPSDLTLDRAFRFQFVPGTASAPTVLPFPTTQGFILTQVQSTYHPQTGSVSVPRVHYSLNGGAPQYIPTGIYGQGNFPYTPQILLEGKLDPPLVIRPGDTFTIWNDAQSPNIDVTICGYFVYPGEV